MFMKKLVRYLVLAAVFVLLFCVSAQAEITVGDVRNLHVKSIGENSVTLKWAAVKGATAYQIFQVKGKTEEKIATVKLNTCAVKNLKPGKTYRYKVRAYISKGQKKYRGGFSDTVEVSPQVLKPSAPKGLEVYVDGENTLQLSWEKSELASWYQIFQYNEKKKEYTKVATTRNLSCTLKKLKAGKTYTYAVRAVREAGNLRNISDYSAKKTGTPIKLSAAAKSIRTYRYYATVRSTEQVYNYTTKKTMTVSAGTRVISSRKTVFSNAPYENVWLMNGQQIKIRFSNLIVPQGIEINPNTDYSTAVKEEYINSKNLKSETDYLVWISQYHTRVNIFKGSTGKWKLVRSFKVAIGRNGSVKGLRKICGKIRYGHYDNTTPVIQWSPMGNAFHTLLGATPGTAVSDGCIRCETADLMYLYDVVPMNTLVYSY